MFTIRNINTFKDSSPGYLRCTGISHYSPPFAYSTIKTSYNKHKRNVKLLSILWHNRTAALFTVGYPKIWIYFNHSIADNYLVFSRTKIYLLYLTYVAILGYHIRIIAKITNSVIKNCTEIYLYIYIVSPFARAH